jgi:hypothetical protein
MSEFNVVAHVRDGGAPTIRKIVWRAVENNLNVVSLVRQPTSKRQAGIAVFILGPNGMREVGPMLLHKARQLGDHKPEERLLIKPDDSLKFLFQWMENVPVRWAYDSKLIDGHGVTLVAFIGNEVCKEISVLLNERGVPTNLK